jgi:hypothetical protein
LLQSTDDDQRCLVGMLLDEHRPVGSLRLSRCRSPRNDPATYP